MSMQARLTLRLLELLATHRVLTVPMALDHVEYDVNSIRQHMNVMVETGWATVSGTAPDGRTKLFVPGPKLIGTGA